MCQVRVLWKRASQPLLLMVVRFVEASSLRWKKVISYERVLLPICGVDQRDDADAVWDEPRAETTADIPGAFSGWGEIYDPSV
jgi:hypothetical protein